MGATEHKELGTQFGVKGYPALKFFKNGVPQEYNGGRTADTIVQWLEKKSGPAAKTLETTEDADAFMKDNRVAALGFFKDPIAKEAVAFATAADANEDVNFAIISNSAVFAHFDVKDDAAVIVLKKFDEGRNNLEGDITVETVTEFVNANSLPLVVDFNTDTAKQIFQGNLKTIFMLQERLPRTLKETSCLSASLLMKRHIRKSLNSLVLLMMKFQPSARLLLSKIWSSISQMTLHCLKRILEHL